MAEISSSSSSSRRLSTRVDMTPMVDLGFLLITFFILTTSLSKSKTMLLTMPDKSSGITSPVDALRTVTLVLDKDDKIYLYRGMLERNTEKEQVKPENLRNRLLSLKNEIAQQTQKDIMVIIKATSASSYKNMVDVFDEMSICGISKYALVDTTPKDLAFVK